jgi:hypothetical protein
MLFISDRSSRSIGLLRNFFGRVNRDFGRIELRLKTLTGTIMLRNSLLLSTSILFAMPAANAQWPDPLGFPSDGFGDRGYLPFPPPVYRPPQSVIIDRKVIAAPALPPAHVRLVHRRNETLNVEVLDRKLKRPVFQGQIPPGQSVDLTLPRDAGGHVVETYQAVNAWGDSVQRTVTRALPTSIRYEVIVHEWQIQSIAIDRTGKSPSPIEDVNYQGRGLGRFTLPAGDQLIDGQIDVYRAAVGANNAGLVAPIATPTQDDGPTRDPLREVLEQVNRRPR